MGTFRRISKRRRSQINDAVASYYIKMHYNSKLRAKERLFEPKDLAVKFAMWFAVNKEFYKGETVGEIYDKWLINVTDI